MVIYDIYWKGLDTMPRPKGSKNKKTLEAEARLGETIAEQKAALAVLAKEQKKLLKEIGVRKDRLKTVQRELRKGEKNLKKLAEKKTEADAAAAETVKKQKMQELVTALMDSGMSSEEILKKLG